MYVHVDYRTVYGIPCIRKEVTHSVHLHRLHRLLVLFAAGTVLKSNLTQIFRHLLLLRCDRRSNFHRPMLLPGVSLNASNSDTQYPQRSDDGKSAADHKTHIQHDQQHPDKLLFFALIRRGQQECHRVLGGGRDKRNLRQPK